MTAVITRDQAFRCLQCDSPWVVIWSVPDDLRSKFPDASLPHLLSVALRSAATNHAYQHDPSLQVRRAREGE